MRADARALMHRIGRRGAILLILAVIDVSYGLSLIGPPRETLSMAVMRWREHYAPLWAWGIGWLVIAAILIVSAFLRNDRFGYAAAIGWKIAWSLTTLASWIVGGVDRGWVSSIIWAVVAGMIVVIGGWPEPHRIARAERRR
ncbi:MAG: hypothetical protein ACJ786_01130 [Catenulispora sp.]